MRDLISMSDLNVWTCFVLRQTTQAIVTIARAERLIALAVERGNGSLSRSTVRAVEPTPDPRPFDLQRHTSHGREGTAMPGDPNRHSPGSTTIEPRDKSSKNRQGAAEKAADPPREENHIESPGHVERELSENARDAQNAKGAWPNEGEGNKTADRTYRKGTEEFVRSGRVEKQARKAAEALDGDEGPELRKAEDKGRRGNPRTKAR